MPAATPALRWLIGLCACVLGALLFVRGAGEIYTAFSGAPADLEIDLRLARAFRDGYSPYTPEGARRANLDRKPSDLGHPPSTVFWALPLTGFGDIQAKTILGLLCISLLLLEIVTMTRDLRSPIPLPVSWLVFAFVTSSEFFAYHLRVGQISALIGFGFFVAWMGIRSGDDWLSGIALGAVCSLKPFPGVVVLPFLVWKRFKVAASALGIYLLISAFMTTRFGLESWILFMQQQKPVADIWMDSIQNQSLHGIVMRLFQPSCGPHGPVLRIAAVLSSAISLVLIGGGCFLAYRMPRTRHNHELLLAGFVPLAMFTSQWSWEHYNVILVVPFAILVSQLAGDWKRGASRAWVILGAASLVGVLAAVRIPIFIKRALQKSVRAGDHALHLKLHVFEALNSAPVVLLLAVAFAMIIARLRAAPRG